MHGRNSRNLSTLDSLKTEVLENVGLFVIVKDERSYTQNRMSRHNWATSLSFFTLMHWKGNGNPLQCSCLENPRDEGAWWAALYGVAQNQTRLKWLSSSSSSGILEKHNFYYWLRVGFLFKKNSTKINYLKSSQQICSLYIPEFFKF